MENQNLQHQPEAKAGSDTNKAMVPGSNNSMPLEDETLLLRKMRAAGGDFASRLADAWLKADSGNSTKLRSQFGQLLESFRCYPDSVLERR